MDCVAALTEAAGRTSDAGGHEAFARIAAECQNHVRAWQERLHTLGNAPGKPNRATAWLNRTKVQILAPFGRRAIAFAVTSNPANCMTVYKRVAQRVDMQQPTRDLASQMLHDATFQSEAIRNARQARHPRCARTVRQHVDAEKLLDTKPRDDDMAQTVEELPTRMWQVTRST